MTEQEQQELNDRLLIISRYNMLDEVKELITKGAEVNARDNNDMTPLHVATHTGQLEVVKYLIEKGADVEAKDQWGQTPLHKASLYGQLKVVKYLIEKGAEVEAREKGEQTPLHMASENGYLEVVKYLVEEAKAEVDARDQWEQTPLKLASFAEHVEVEKYLFFERNALMPIVRLFIALMEHMGKNTEAQNIFAYVLQNKHRYTEKEIQDVKTLFLKFNMNEEDTRNLKPIVNFL